MGKQKYDKFPDDIEIDKYKVETYSRQTSIIDDEIKACEKELQELKQRKIEIGRKLLPQPVLWDLFYNHNVNTKEICDRFGIKNIHELKQIVGSCDVVSRCGVCGSELRVTVKNRTHLKEVQEGKSTYKQPGFHRVDNMFVCDECIEVEKHKIWENRQSEQMQFGLRLQELKAMDYTDFLKTPEWDATRRAMLRKAKYTCQLCNKDGVTLNVHHKTYERIGEELTDDLIVLCKSCHAKFHDKDERLGKA
jgi:hypothetical protein